MKVTLADIARAAGVSTATVDRVVNARSRVRRQTRHHVLTVARRLGYPGVDGGDAETPPAIRLRFVVPGGPNSFLNGFAQALAGVEARSAGLDLVVHRTADFRPETVMAGLRQLGPGSHGVGLIAPDHPLVREGIRELAGANVPVLTMVTDVPNVPRVGYVGIDNRTSGRLAGHLLGRFLHPGPHKVALIAGSLSYRGHEEREMGFRHILAEVFPQLEVVELRENFDDFRRGYEQTNSILDDHPDLGGIYNIGAGNRGIASALEEHGRAATTVFIGHELTEHSRRFLLSGTMDAVIDQQPALEARLAVEALVAAARRQAVDRASLVVPAHVIFRENIPSR